MLPICQVAGPLLAAGVKITSTRVGPNFDLANVMWILQDKYLGLLLEFYTEQQYRDNEMALIAQYHIQRPGNAERLPVYWDSFHDPNSHFNKFNAIFDAAALGQWAGGADPRNFPNYVALCCFHNLLACVVFFFLLIPFTDDLISHPLLLLFSDLTIFLAVLTAWYGKMCLRISLFSLIFEKLLRASQ